MVFRPIMQLVVPPETVGLHAVGKTAEADEHFHAVPQRS